MPGPAVEDDIHAACLYSADASNLGKPRKIPEERAPTSPSSKERKENIEMVRHAYHLKLYSRSIHRANLGAGHRNSVRR